MYKLFKLGVKGKAWSLINDMYSKTQGSVVVNKCKSNDFVVKEGVRQGGILSGFLYLVFINELINELERCNRVTGVNSIKSVAHPHLLTILHVLLQHRSVYNTCLIYVQDIQINGGFSSTERNHVLFNFQNLQ